LAKLLENTELALVGPPYEMLWYPTVLDTWPFWPIIHT
jgi:hypothetical protein